MVCRGPSSRVSQTAEPDPQGAGQAAGQDAVAQLPPQLPASLPELEILTDSRDLKDLANVKLTEENFIEWKAYMMAEFRYYSINKIIDGSRLSSTSAKYRDYWIEIEHLFECHLAINLPSNIYQIICQKASLRDKWNAILQLKT